MRTRYPESARLTVTLGAGRVVAGFCGEAYGMPGRPLTDEDLHSKFTDCVDFAGGLVPNGKLDGTDLLDLARDGAVADEPASIVIWVQMTTGVVAAYKTIASDSRAVLAQGLQSVAFSIAAK
jgi:hypothetical protein